MRKAPRTRGSRWPRLRSMYADKIEAESKVGVLVVHLPKKAEAKPKSIQVKVN